MGDPVSISSATPVAVPASPPRVAAKTAVTAAEEPAESDTAAVSGVRTAGQLSGQTATSDGGASTAVTGAQKQAAQTVLGSGPVDTRQATEATRREEIFARLTDGTNFSTGVSAEVATHRKDVMMRAMSAYSLDQLTQMDTAGVKLKVDNLRKRGEETDGAYGRAGLTKETPDGVPTLIMDQSLLDDPKRTGKSELVARHELGHAWDDVQSPDQGHALDPKISINLSDSGRLLDVGGGKKMTVQQMYERYTARVEKALDRSVLGTFDSKFTDAGYSTQNAQEFYAEGQAVFHSNETDRRDRMRQYAPELYNVLLAEARQQGTLPPGLH